MDDTESHHEAEIRAIIAEEVRDGMSSLSDDERLWAASRLTDARHIKVRIIAKGEEVVDDMWLVTLAAIDTPGEYRIVYDPALLTFGIVAGGDEVGDYPTLVGLYGDFAETVHAL